nr:MAG TPA: thioredoxin [Herelleviridae sp.]
MALKDITNKDYDNYKEGTHLLDFWAPWCSPCKMLAPVIKEVSKDNEDFDILKINIDEEEELAEKFDVMSIPTLILIKDGEVVETLNGFQPKEVIENLVKNNK